MKEKEQNSYKKKIIILSIVIVMTIVLIIGVSILLIKDLSSDSNTTEASYGLIKDVKDGYIIVSDIDDDTTKKVATDREYQVGDFVSVADNQVEVIAERDELAKMTEEVESTTTTSTTSKSTSTTTTKKIQSDEAIIEYMQDIDDTIESEDNQNTIKDIFIKCVDFIFYDEPINGVTWDELSNKAKSKVIYYTLLIDSKIDAKYPGYKDKIGSKVADIKARLVAKYMDLAVGICKTTDDDCFQVKSDFALLKHSLKITWDIIKSAFTYGYERTTTYLKNWYEVFSGKL